VTGAADDAQADHVARKLVNSPLVRCALAGADPNWGRLVMALGNTGVAIDLGGLSVDVADGPLVRNGVVISEDALNDARKVMKRDAYTMTVRLGDGPGAAMMITSDLTEEYVRFNSAYTS